MTPPTLRRLVAGATAALLVPVGAVATAPSAGAAVVEPFVSAQAYTYVASGTCQGSQGSSDEPGLVPWSDDGVAVSRSAATSAALGGADGAVGDYAASGAATLRSTPLGTAGPATVVVTGSGVATATPRATVGACRGGAQIGVTAGGRVDLPVPTWVRVTSTNSSATGYTNSSLMNGDGSVAIDLRHSTVGVVSSRVLLPAGQAVLYASMGTSATVRDGAAERGAAAGSVRFDLEPAGYAAPAVGRAAGLVRLGDRSCAAGATTARVTRRAARTASSVTVRVNGAKVAVLKGRKLRARSLVLPVAAGAPAVVTATVVPRRKGRALSTSRSYLACSD